MDSRRVPADAASDPETPGQAHDHGPRDRPVARHGLRVREIEEAQLTVRVRFTSPTVVVIHATLPTMSPWTGSGAAARAKGNQPPGPEVSSVSAPPGQFQGDEDAPSDSVDVPAETAIGG